VRCAFYGRVSTEDHQDPVTSLARQQAQAAALVAGHGRIVAEFFDIGQSRTLAWARRPQAAALVAAEPVNLNEAPVWGVYWVAASFWGGLIQEVTGSFGGAGGLETNRSGCWW
jgi:hypothetical protein